MSFEQEIEANYVDGNGLVAPYRVTRDNVNGSDNGVTFTSEYFVILNQLGKVTTAHLDRFKGTIGRCFREPGLLSRSPHHPDQEGPDDYYGLAAACVALNDPKLATDVVTYGKKHRWNFNNVTPGKFTGSSFLGRQPQLVCALYSAAKKFTPFILPLRIYTALVIAISCIRTPVTDTDSRRLAWLLIQATEPSSILCRLAAKIWRRRLLKAYGPTGLQAVSQIYYQADHPFIKYRPPV